MGNMIPGWLRALIDPGAAVPGLEAAAPWLIAAFLGGYLLGSIPFGVLMARVFGLGDLRKVGSGNIGATNVLRTGNKAAAAATLVLDAAKGALPVLVAGLWGPDTAVLAGAGALIGHCFPVWLKFRGGKGVATFLGVVLALSLPVGALACATWLAVAFVMRISSLSALVAVAAAPVLLWAFGRLEAVLIVAALSVLVWVRHHENIARLVQGTEPRIGASRGGG